MTSSASDRISAHPSPGGGTLDGWQLWRAWIAVNAAGELIGLAFPAMVGVGLVWGFGSAGGLRARLLGAAAMVLAGVVEGVVVGWLQWRVLRRVWPAIGLGPWARWTALGAAVAWALGMMPSTLLHQDAGPPAPDLALMNEWMKYALAAAMGFALGPMLGFPQWLVLRRHAPRAGWWVAANAVAWAFGMPVIFFAAGSVAPGASPLWIAALAGGTFALAGAAVGAIHGLVLMRLASEVKSPTATSA